MDWVEIEPRTVSKAGTHLTSKPLQGLSKEKLSHHWHLQGVYKILRKDQKLQLPFSCYSGRL